MTFRKIDQIIHAREQAEGMGATVRRSIGTPSLPNLSPFLMMDHAYIKPPAGFPDHPHRGQETITYVLSGGIDHEDFTGSKGSLEAGDLQFMTAGRGVVHAEMPREGENGEASEGIQIWVDLPAELKDCEPRYRDLKAADIPKVEADGGRARITVISGQSHGVDSVKDLAYTPVWLLDVELKPGARIEQPLPHGWTAFAYILDGSVSFADDDNNSTPGRKAEVVKRFNNVVFDAAGDSIVLRNPPTPDDKSARVLVVAGTPLDQPIVQYGPFVMTSREGVAQAFADYRSFRNGFERARDFRSEVGQRLMAS